MPTAVPSPTVPLPWSGGARLAVLLRSRDDTGRRFSGAADPQESAITDEVAHMAVTLHPHPAMDPVDRPPASSSAAFGDPRTTVSATPPRLVLEVSRGRTQFPQRPVTSPRFFIGSNENCELRLGGNLPGLHSVILQVGRNYWICPVASEPPLLVNGEALDGEWLRDGDVAEIGPIQFVVHLDAPSDAARQPVINWQAPVDLDEVFAEEADARRFERSPREMTAAELVEALEREMDIVEEHDRHQAAAMSALLQAMQRRAVRYDRSMETDRTGDLDAEPSAAPPEWAAELEQLSDDLNLIADELSRREQRALEREVDYVQATDSLLDIQQRLLEQIEALSRQVQAMNRVKDRASA